MKDSIGNNSILFEYYSIDDYNFKNKTFHVSNLIQCPYIFNDTLYHNVLITCKKSGNQFSDIISLSLDEKDGEFNKSRSEVNFLVDQN